MREAIEARITGRTVELFHRGTRVASHIRSPLRGRHTTITEHMPRPHRRYADWTPTLLMREAAVIGPSTAALVEQILPAKPHPEQGFRACLGILRLCVPEVANASRRPPRKVMLPYVSRGKRPVLNKPSVH
jgi:transposase